MRPITSTFIILFCCLLTAQAQTGFQLAIGGPGEETCAKVLTGNGRYHFLGHTTSAGAGSYDICYIQTDTGGKVLHTTVAGIYGEDIAISGAAHGTKYAATGYTSSLGYEFPFVAVFDTSGNMDWNKYFPMRGWGLAIAASNDGGYLVTGQHDAASPNINMFLMKLDAQGHVQWAHTYGDTLIDEGRAIMQAADGSIYVGGITHTQPGGPSDAVLIKTDGEGKLLWSKKYGVPGWDLTQKIAAIGNGVLLGAISYTDKFASPVSEDILLIHIDAQGNIKNSFVVGSADYDQVRDIAVRPDGKFTITGLTTAFGGGKTDLLIATLDTNGTIYQQEVYGAGDFENGLSLALDGHNLLAAGYTETFGGGQNDMYLLKLNDAAGTPCYQHSSSLQSVPIALTAKQGLPADTLMAEGFDANMLTQHPTLPYLNLCPTTGITDAKESGGYQLYPNPAGEKITLRIPRQMKVEKILLYNSMGSIVQTPDYNHQQELTIALTLLAPGGYYLVVQSDAGVQNLPFVKY